jgi:two-component system sensor histidine kinase CpxA
MTKTIRRITAATGNIADGHFDVTLAATRRDELGQLSDSINRMAGRLSGYVHGQKRFLGDIAHELSSPIARMQMALGVLEQRSSEREATYVADVREELEHMSTLVNELLQFSRSGIARQKCSLQPVDIPDVLRRAVNREGVPEVIFRTEVDPDVHAMADPECLFRAFANIIRNAVRYAGDAGPITLSAKENSDRVRISIADCGPGIPASELENIFRPFYRPEFARTRETGGVGLGLAIVRDSIESCGGRVECRNRIPQGLEVVIELTPAKAPSSAGAH